MTNSHPNSEYTLHNRHFLKCKMILQNSTQLTNRSKNSWDQLHRRVANFKTSYCIKRCSPAHSFYNCSQKLQTAPMQNRKFRTNQLLLHCGHKWIQILWNRSVQHQHSSNKHHQRQNRNANLQPRKHDRKYTYIRWMNMYLMLKRSYPMHKALKSTMSGEGPNVHSPTLIFHFTKRLFPRVRTLDLADGK